jgi:hypothetical protein
MSVIKYVFSLLFLVLLSGCLQDYEDVNVQYMDMAVIKHYGSYYLIITDDGVKLLTDELPLDEDFDDNLRAIVKYYLIGIGGEDKEYDYIVTVEEIKEIQTKDIIFINDDNRDTLGSAEVDFNEVWITEDYLTVYFSFLMGKQDHYFNLTFDEKEQILGDTIVLTFRHQDNNDHAVQELTGYITFNLDTLQTDDRNERVILFKGKEYQNREFRQELVYSY